MSVQPKTALDFIPGYTLLNPNHEKKCIDRIVDHPRLRLWIAVFEKIENGKWLSVTDKRERRFLADNVRKVLEPLRVWQGRDQRWQCIAWGIYLLGLIMALCLSLGTLNARIFGLLTHFYYLNTVFMVLSFACSCHGTARALKQLRLDYALTMEFPALGYGAAAFYPSLYELPWYNFMIIGLTTLNLVVNSILPKIHQDLLSQAHKRRTQQAIDRGPVTDRPFVVAEPEQPLCEWQEALDLLERDIEEIRTCTRFAGSARHNRQMALLLEGWSNVIIRFYDELDENTRHQRLAEKPRTVDAESSSSWMVKLVMSLVFFPVAFARMPPLYKAGEYGAFVQSCIAVIDVGVYLSYMTRSSSYTIPAFSDLYSPCLIFSIAGLVPIWVQWWYPDIFSQGYFPLAIGYGYMFLVTFIVGPVLIGKFKLGLVDHFASKQAKKEWLESLTEPGEYALGFPVEYPLEYRMGRSDGDWTCVSIEYPNGLPNDFARCFPSLFPPVAIPEGLVEDVADEPSRLLPHSSEHSAYDGNLRGVVDRLDKIVFG